VISAEHISAITPNTTTRKEAVLEIIDRAVLHGYATESEESCMGVRCFGVALPFTHQAVDALSVAVPISRLDNGREDLIIETLLSVKARLAGFLIQYWGGPQTYSEQRGHPRLRMRHNPFVIGEAEAAAWYGHMEAALGAMAADEVVRPVFLEYFARAAEAMINVAS